MLARTRAACLRFPVRAGPRARVLCAAGAGAVSFSVSAGVALARGGGVRVAAADGDTAVRIACYNVLSDSLCDPGHFNHCLPADCDGPTRLTRVKAKLAEQMKTGSVLCLQEVSRNWAGELVPFFEERGYSYMAACAGGQFGGYMGPCLAWPTDKYAAAEVSSMRLSDTVGWKHIKNKGAKDGLWTRLCRAFWDTKPPRKPFEPRAKALERYNCVVVARLRRRDDGKAFCVATYHMPCLFGSDIKCQVMTMHASWLMQHAQRFAGTDPLVVAGDFNIKPFDPAYALLRDGHMPSDHPQHPPAAPARATKAERGWSPTHKPMRSAYVEASSTNEEPEFTNFAWNKHSGEQFCATLDYIWLSPEWGVRGVRELPARASLPPSVESFPSDVEPSDHMLIAAELTL